MKVGKPPPRPTEPVRSNKLCNLYFVSLSHVSVSIAGPVAQRVITPVAIGKKFNVEIQMTIPLTLEEAQKYRIRAHAYKGDDIFENFDCKSLSNVDSSDAFDTDAADGPPTAVRSVPKGTILIWEDVRVTVDELVTEATAGDMYAVCFCDGAGLGCDSPDRFQTLVQAWKLSGRPRLEDFRLLVKASPSFVVVIASSMRLCGGWRI